MELAAPRVRLTWSPSAIPQWIAYFALMLLGSLLLRMLASDAPGEVFPSLSVMLLWAVPLWLTSRLCNRFSKALVSAWILWFVIGSCNLVASNLALSDFYLVNANPAAIVYICGVTVLSLALLATESLLRRDATTSEMESRPVAGASQSVPPLYCLFLLVFPVAYCASMVMAVGQPPILRGRSFVEEIYDTNYGPLYGYGTVLVFSLLFVLHRAWSSQSWPARVIWITLLFLYLFVAIADGKRFYAVIALLASYPLYSSATNHGPGPRAAIGTLLATAIGGLIYLGVLVIRSAYELTPSAILPYALAAVGVEYRDFAYSVDHFAPGGIPNYDWFRSTFFSLVNSQVLAAANVDKAAETLRGSAYVWRDLFGSVFGIRTGIISELYFGYGVWGAPILFLIGMLIGVVTQRLKELDRGPTRPFWAVLYAIGVLMIVGQSTATAGLVSLVGYTFLVYWVAKRVTLQGRPQGSALKGTPHAVSGRNRCRG